MGLGYRSESGEAETLSWASGKTVQQASGPLGFVSQTESVPLTEIEEAIIAWAGLGPNGIVAADVPVQGDLSGLLYWAGRTAPGSSNDQSVDLVIINDRGVHLYRPGTARSKPVEIEGPDDYWKVLHWYRAGLTTLADTRPDVDWGASPPGTHNVRPMGVAQYNVNRPGSTWFLPVGDLGREWVNLMLSSYQSSGFYLEDPKTRKPAGCDQWIRPGFLEVAFPMPVFDELVLLLHAGQVGAVVQNMRLACEALGLGAWGMGNYSDDLLLGAYPEVCRGLGFRFIERDPDRNPSRTTTCVGLEEHLEATAVPTPWLPDARTAVNRVLESRYGAGGTLSREHNWALESGGPFKPEVVEKIVEHPRAHVPDWVVEAAVETIDYVASEYGCAPAYISPVRAKYSLQVHHVDVDYYARFHTDAFLINDRIRDHLANWHSEEGA
jgi:nitroreductase